MNDAGDALAEDVARAEAARLNARHKQDLDTLRSSAELAESKLAEALERERNTVASAHTELEKLAHQCIEYIAQHQAEKSRIATLHAQVEALMRWVEHSPGCEITNTEFCTCGLREARSAVLALLRGET